MSTIYVFNDEISTSETALADDDLMLVHDTSGAVKKKVPISVVKQAALGNTSVSKIAFFGAATSVGRYANSIAQPASTASASVSATQWAFATSAQADAIITAVHRMASAFAFYGLATSA